MIGSGQGAWTGSMEVLVTKRLLLQPFEEADRVEMHRIVYADPRVAPNWSGKTWAIEEISESFDRKLEQRDDGLDFRAIELKGTSDLIGLIGFQRYQKGEIEQHMEFEDETSRLEFDPLFPEVELTYALGHAFRGHGYAVQAGKAMIDYGFRVLNIGRIVNSVALQNVRSVNPMRRLGFRIRRSLKPKLFGGPWKDSAGVIGTLENPQWRNPVPEAD